MSFAGLCFVLASFIGTAYVLNAIENANINTKTYGTVGHEISYDKSNLSESEVDVIAEAFTKINFFDDKGKWYIYARKVENNYEISISVTKPSLTNQQDLYFFNQLRSEMQSFFPKNKIVIKLFVGDYNKIGKRIE